MGNKLRSYRLFKESFNTESYLDMCKNEVHRSNICRLRISCHNLFIETGRYRTGTQRLKPEERICSFCNLNQVEDEKHFILNCTLYADERRELVKKINMIYKGFDNLSDDNKFAFIMRCDCKDILWALGHYITTGFKKRNT